MKNVTMMNVNGTYTTSAITYTSITTLTTVNNIENGEIGAINMDNKSMAAVENTSALLDMLKANGVTFKVVNKTVKRKSHANIDDAGIATCINCNDKFDYDALDDDTKALVDKYGLCPTCAHKYNEFTTIKTSMKKNNTAPRVINREKTNGKSAFAVMMEMINNSTFTKDMLADLTDADYCKKNLGLTYPLFKEIPAGSTAADIKIIRSDVKGKARYAARIMNIDDVNVVITNDIYAHKLNKISDGLKAIGALA